MSSIADLVAQRIRQQQLQQQQPMPLGAQAALPPPPADAPPPPMNLGAQAGMAGAPGGMADQQLLQDQSNPMLQMAALRYLDAQRKAQGLG